MTIAPKSGDDVLIIPGANRTPVGFRCIAPESGDDCVIIMGANGVPTACAGVAPKSGDDCFVVMAANGVPVAMVPPDEEDPCKEIENYFTIWIELAGLTYETYPGGDCDNGSTWVTFAYPAPWVSPGNGLVSGAGTTHGEGTCGWDYSFVTATWEIRDSADPATLIASGSTEIHTGMSMDRASGIAIIGFGGSGLGLYPFVSKTLTIAQLRAAAGTSLSPGTVAMTMAAHTGGVWASGSYCPYNPTGTANIRIVDSRL
jgi:hypothetical protein